MTGKVTVGTTSQWRRVIDWWFINQREMSIHPALQSSMGYTYTLMIIRVEWRLWLMVVRLGLRLDPRWCFRRGGKCLEGKMSGGQMFCIRWTTVRREIYRITDAASGDRRSRPVVDPPPRLLRLHALCYSPWVTAYCIDSQSYKSVTVWINI